MPVAHSRRSLATGPKRRPALSRSSPRRSRKSSMFASTPILVIHKAALRTRRKPLSTRRQSLVAVRDRCVNRTSRGQSRLAARKVSCRATFRPAGARPHVTPCARGSDCGARLPRSVASSKPRPARLPRLAQHRRAQFVVSAESRHPTDRLRACHNWIIFLCDVAARRARRIVTQRLACREHTRSKWRTLS